MFVSFYSTFYLYLFKFGFELIQIQLSLVLMIKNINMMRSKVASFGYTFNKSLPRFYLYFCFHIYLCTCAHIAL